jgi:predicted secreted Zn-dependent protease
MEDGVSVTGRWALAALTLASVLAGCASAGTGLGAPWGSRVRVEVASRVSTEFYPVHGTTAQEILDDMFTAARRHRPASGLLPGDAVGWVSFETRLPSWQPREAFGGCVADTLTLELTQTIALPRHADPEGLSPEVRTRWNIYTDGLQGHEQRHVEINREGLRTMQAEFQALGPHPSCAQLIQAVEDIWRRGQQRILDAHTAFHRDDDARRHLIRRRSRPRSPRSGSGTRPWRPRCASCASSARHSPAAIPRGSPSRTRSRPSTTTLRVKPTRSSRC